MRLAGSQRHPSLLIQRICGEVSGGGVASGGLNAAENITELSQLLALSAAWVRLYRR